MSDVMLKPARLPAGEIAVLNALLENGPSHAFEIRKTFGFNRYQTVSRAIGRLKTKKYVEYLLIHHNEEQRGKTVRLTKLGLMAALATAVRPPFLPAVLENNRHLITRRKHRLEVLLQLWNADSSTFDYLLMIYALKWPSPMESFMDQLFSDHVVFMSLTGTQAVRQTIQNLRKTKQWVAPAFEKFKAMLG
ncbi:MAG: MarR family transcriptional regulator [Thaumarchaeota archaeon]|nr:MarR family transcriptional regulator [Nitrososphaerota archaeon]